MSNTNVKIELTVDEVKDIMRKATRKVDSTGFKPGERCEDFSLQIEENMI